MDRSLQADAQSHTDTCTNTQDKSLVCKPGWTRTHMYLHTLSHTLSRSLSHTERWGAAHCCMRPASVLCALVQHVLLMTRIQACFLHCVWAAALSYQALWHIIPGCGRVKLHVRCSYYGTAWLPFSVRSTFHIIDDTEPWQAAWVRVVLTSYCFSGREMTARHLSNRLSVCLGGKST